MVHESCGGGQCFAPVAPERATALRGAPLLMEVRMPSSRLLAALLLAAAAAGCDILLWRTPTDRLYVMDCGHNAALDQSRWSPGVNVGKPIDLSDNCYLIRHGKQWLLWDTGYPDAVADKPVTSAAGTATRARKLAAQLAEIRVNPDDIQWVAVLHRRRPCRQRRHVPEGDPSHREGELDFAFAPWEALTVPARAPGARARGRPRRLRRRQRHLLSTPGHTPGHQSLLLRLPQTGWLVLSGDLTHFRDNWENRRVASMNTSPEQTQASLQRVAQILADKPAQLWINHDKLQSNRQRHSPAYYDPSSRGGCAAPAFAGGTSSRARRAGGSSGVSPARAPHRHVPPATR